MDPLNETNLTAHSWLSVVTFLIVIAIVIRPIRIPLPIPVYENVTDAVAVDTDAEGDTTDRSIQETPPTSSKVDQARIHCEGSGISNNNHVGVTAVPEDVIPYPGSSSSNSQATNGQGKADDSLPAKSPTTINTIITNNFNSDTAHDTNSNKKIDNLEGGSQKRKKTYPYDITLDIATAPVLGVLFLLATRSINGQSVRDGIMGEPTSGVEPYAVMVLFFSLVR
ncbi:hypothetical protein BGZ47_011532 [Haplosporangium gracile]|nr:hypothetical protein BGZ47_011532 [Haplosporangium gracile]